jgi:hypothetical protein
MTRSSQHDPADAPRRGLRGHGSASLSELREFIAKMRGKPPQEVLGMIAQSGLARAMSLATLLVLLMVVVGTAVPFAWNQITGQPGKSGKAAQAVSSPTDKSAESAKEPAKTGSAGAETTEPKAKRDPKEAILDKLGIGETKTAPKGINPLEGRTDDILKDLDRK